MNSRCILSSGMDLMNKLDYEDNFRAALNRLLPETYNLMSVQAALEALHAAGCAADDPAIQKALVFVKRWGMRPVPGVAVTLVNEAPVVPYSAMIPAHVAGDATAYYTVWRIGCGLVGPDGSATPSFYFEQRDWYLPGAQILIVDEYSIPGLAAVLAAATWR